MKRVSKSQPFLTAGIVFVLWAGAMSTASAQSETTESVSENWNLSKVPEGFAYGDELPKEGILIKGTKNTINHPRIRPDEPVILMGHDEWTEFQKSELPAETIPRLKKGFGLVQELFSAIRGGPEVGSDFDYAAPLTELCCLGTLALRTGKQVDYDPTTMSFKDASLNPYIKAPVRTGWEYGEDLW